ncbi:hypothetical protein WN51_08635 [Melipona quadrifasciata]|uniref:Ig-like domain-containing protein n=1 Tax=Melipona quadrifasciata TaxID=166423 RepID=A0A0M9A8X7_9HYME|nr:hypothetical protein WN51_08635 [Melipona quadrifasciata]
MRAEQKGIQSRGEAKRREKRERRRKEDVRVKEDEEERERNVEGYSVHERKRREKGEKVGRAGRAERDRGEKVANVAERESGGGGEILENGLRGEIKRFIKQTSIPYYSVARRRESSNPHRGATRRIAEKSMKFKGTDTFVMLLDTHQYARQRDKLTHTQERGEQILRRWRQRIGKQCQIDAREKPVTKAQHSSDSGVFGPRAYFRTAFPSPAVLVIEDIKRHDAATYRCRVDFRKGQTRSFRYNLTVIVLASVETGATYVPFDRLFDVNRVQSAVNQWSLVATFLKIISTDYLTALWTLLKTPLPVPITFVDSASSPDQ